MRAHIYHIYSYFIIVTCFLLPLPRSMLWKLWTRSEFSSVSWFPSMGNTTTPCLIYLESSVVCLFCDSGSQAARPASFWGQYLRTRKEAEHPKLPARQEGFICSLTVREQCALANPFLNFMIYDLYQYCFVTIVYNCVMCLDVSKVNTQMTLSHPNLLRREIAPK